VARVVATVVVPGEDSVWSPERTSSTAIVTAARNAAGAPYRFSSPRQPRAKPYQPDTAQTSRRSLAASRAAAVRQSSWPLRKA
jgi:hypothetical protein